MSNRRGLYLVPKTLDAPIRILALPLDEFIPAAILGVCFFFWDKVFCAIVLPMGIILLLRFLKKGQGSSGLLSLCYWFLPKIMMRCLFRYTPASQDREYIA